MFTPEHNKAQARKWFEEVWGQRRTSTIFEMLGPEAVGHTEFGDKVGPEPFAGFQAVFLAAFPDLEIAVEQVIGEGDVVAVRWCLRGTHQGEIQGIPATGKRAQARGTTWLRFESGRLVEGWDTWNAAGLLGQLTGA